MTEGDHREAARVRIGSLVHVVDREGDDEFRVVGPEDADIMDRRISTDSPMGRALLGRAAGERVKVETPAGAWTVTIVEVQ